MNGCLKLVNTVGHSQIVNQTEESSKKLGHPHYVLVWKSSRNKGMLKSKKE